MVESLVNDLDFLIMKKFYHAFYIFILTSITACQDMISYELVKKYKDTLEWNYIIVGSSTNTSVTVDVEYSIALNDSENIVEKKQLTTPFLIGGQKVVANSEMYNIIQYPGKRYLRQYRENIPDYSEGGSHYLKIHNNSNITLEYAIIGTQKLTFRQNNLIKNAPIPIYHGIPVLFLLKPELAPNKTCLFKVSKPKTCYGDVPDRYNLTSIELFDHQLGKYLKPVLPFTLENILELYRQEYRNRKSTLYFDYEAYSTSITGISGFKNSYDVGETLFGRISPGEIINSKKLPLLSTSI